MAKKHFTHNEALEIGNQPCITWKDFDAEQFKRFSQTLT
jgi:hypothetical protein